MTNNTVRHSDLLTIRCAPEILDRVDRAAAALFQRPSEYIRQALVDRLKHDGALADRVEAV